ncbi:hypothetical protein U6A24_13685 [Aquimarina gracilis]|uniref:Uncharacterized protein n=1 Tax=Aquimarina gracilis TaxID=874422 RepID=A0ABU5ZXC3_9FLAO|nr:hypothetical protein [Aquimarina gracilis]MEB3346524.1 hypothetical protein [Aquimarina gracilis]
MDATVEINNSTKVIDGNITEAQLHTWKNKYGKLVKVEVENDEGETRFAYFRKPTMATRAAVLQTSKTDEFKALEVLFKNCYLGGDEEVVQDDDLKLSVITAFADLTQPKAAKAKKI